MVKERQIAIDTMKNCRKQLLLYIEKVLKGPNNQYFIHHIKEINNFLKPVVSLRPKIWETINDPYDMYQYLINNDDIEKIVSKLANETNNSHYNNYKGWLLINDLASNLCDYLYQNKKSPDDNWWRQQLYFYFEYVGV